MSMLDLAVNKRKQEPGWSLGYSSRNCGPLCCLRFCCTNEHLRKIYGFCSEGSKNLAFLLSGCVFWVWLRWPSLVWINKKCNWQLLLKNNAFFFLVWLLRGEMYHLKVCFFYTCLSFLILALACHLIKPKPVWTVPSYSLHAGPTPQMTATLWPSMQPSTPQKMSFSPSRKLCQLQNVLSNWCLT